MSSVPCWCSAPCSSCCSNSAWSRRPKRNRPVLLLANQSRLRTTSRRAPCETHGGPPLCEAPCVQVHLVDGTYELFRQFLAPRPGHRDADGVEVGATRAVAT